MEGPHEGISKTWVIFLLIQGCSLQYTDSDLKLASDSKCHPKFTHSTNSIESWEWEWDVESNCMARAHGLT